MNYGDYEDDAWGEPTVVLGAVVAAIVILLIIAASVSWADILKAFS